MHVTFNISNIFHTFYSINHTLSWFTFLSAYSSIELFKKEMASNVLKHSWFPVNRIPDFHSSSVFFILSSLWNIQWFKSLCVVVKRNIIITISIRHFRWFVIICPLLLNYMSALTYFIQWQYIFVKRWYDGMNNNVAENKRTLQTLNCIIHFNTVWVNGAVKKHSLIRNLLTVF